jgi:uncharacterized protein (DUF2236 family)
LVDLLALPGLALLPPRLRDEFGIGWGNRQANLARLADRAIRGWVSVVPADLRSMPQAQNAQRRASSGAPARR